MVKAINGQSQYFRFQIFCGHKSPICIWSNPSTSWGTRSAVNGHFQSKIGGLGKRKDINIVMNSVLQEKCILKGCSPCHLCLRIFQRWGCREWRWPGLVEGKQRILPDFLRKAEFSLFCFLSQHLVEQRARPRMAAYAFCHQSIRSSSEMYFPFSFTACFGTINNISILHNL